MKRLHSIVLVLIATSSCSSLFAQQVSTLYFLENAPMRHIVNPAFQPVSDGYVNFTPLGYTSMWVGNNSLTASDVIFNQNGQTVTGLYPGTDRNKLLKQFRKATLMDADMTLDLASFGFRYKEKGYIHISIMERIETGVTLPKTMFDFILNGGMQNLNGVNSYNLKQLGMQLNAYMEIAGGYSHKLNDQWTIGGKLKFLLGNANLTLRNKSLTLDASAQAWYLHGNGYIQGAAPINWNALPQRLSYETIEQMDASKLMDGLSITDYITPQGYGAAIDFGFAYKPHPQVQITAAINDLGFIVWKGANYRMTVDSAFTGIKGLQWSDYYNEDNDYKFDGNQLEDDVIEALKDYAKSIHTGDRKSTYTRMISAKLNVGVDANFCNNILGVGILSKTRLFNGRVYEEVTIGGAVRPCNWFNFALSYSLVNNGKYSNFGAGISLMPYDGINMTLAMDYIPTSYADYKGIGIPYKAKGINVALGFSIVWGTNKPDEDKDGVWNKLDMCPHTPLGVQVDKVGCPIDSDGDGVPDYLDQCPFTPKEAYGMIDSVGCPLDTDKDGVPDYLDKCPDTKPEAVAFVDSLGCDKDTDMDGVPDYLDKCPDTKPEAVAFVDSLGCDKDTDMDGVPDYLDKCPDTKPEAVAFVDSVGCDKDTDKDGVADYMDECPTVPGPAENKGCPVIQKEVRNLLQKAMQGIQFETGKAVIKPISFSLLNKIAVIFIDHPEYVVEIQGHTDNTGKVQLNKTLSQKRADAVLKFLQDAGVKNQMTAVGFGSERPIATNDTKEGRTLNRRVEFSITFEEVSYETIYDHAD
ncbi:MAG: OmpA family protein [Bacteroidales bacterium]|nr:OmpA family protein [Candidatus Colicola equi]